MITATRTPIADYEDDTIRLEEIALEQWRAISTRYPTDDVRALLGFVCRTAGLYEVTVLSRPLESSFCADLPAVHATLSDDGTDDDLPATEPIVVIIPSAT